MNSRIEQVTIACCKSDLHLTRICVASVRYWYPDLPIVLIKDSLQGHFCTRELEEVWQVRIARTSRDVHGWGFAKLEAFFATPRVRSLILDSDTVLLGRVIEKLEAHPEDFLVTGENLPDPSTSYVRENYYDLEQLRRIDPDFSYPGYCFNSGQLVATSGILSESDFAPTVNWSTPPIHRFPGMFIGGEQGLLNYLIPKKTRLGQATTASVDFGRWIGDPAVDQLDLATITSEGLPFVLHWAGPKAPLISGMRRSDILQFFENHYYSRIRTGGFKRISRAVARELSRQPRALARRLRRTLSR
jgi:hypothetical protein